MKIITIPDLHGKNCWKKIDTDLYDRVVFLGDYVDSKGQFTDREEVENLEAIIQLKQKYPEKIVLLLGNHDIQYLYYPNHMANTFNYNTKEVFLALFNTYKNCFSYAFQMQYHLWTHAGVSRSWYNKHLAVINALCDGDPYPQLATILNAMEKKHLDVLTSCSPLRSGFCAEGGIVWADKKETEEDYLPGLHQYVGHTKVPAITTIGDEQSSIHYLDCLNTEEKYFVVEL